MIPRLFWNYDSMLTTIRNLENQDFLSCRSAAAAASPVALVSFFEGTCRNSRCCNDCSLFLNWQRLIPRLFLKYDLMLTKIRNPENQDFFSCHTAAVLAERRGSGGGGGGNLT